MKRTRDGLVPIREAVSSLGGPLKALREASPQALHHFTRFDQVNQLVGASEADPDRGFMARLMALCSLPRTNPGNRKEYKRVNGPYKGSAQNRGKRGLPPRSQSHSVRDTPAERGDYCSSLHPRRFAGASGDHCRDPRHRRWTGVPPHR